MADAGGSSSSSDSGSDASSRPMNEDDVRDLFARERAQAVNHDIVHEQLDLLKSLGSLNFPSVLRSMVRNENWLDIERYLRKALRFHAKEAAEAVAYPPALAGDMRRAHPELYVLPRRQHALRLFSIGRHEEARHYYEEHIQPRILHIRRNAHVDALVASLGAILAGEQPLAGRAYDREAASTFRAITDYIHVYFPRFSSNMKMIRNMNMLGQAWRFGEVLGHDLGPITTARCLVCHAELRWGPSPDSVLVNHLYMECPATTPRIHRLLPRPLQPRHVARRKQLLQKDLQDEADAAAQDDGDNAGGGDDDE